jgi:hypothetical protein
VLKIYSEVRYNERMLNKQFLSIKSECYNEPGGILTADAARSVHDVLGLAALIRASVIILVSVGKVQLSVKFSYLLLLYSA